MFFNRIGNWAEKLRFFWKKNYFLRSFSSFEQTLIVFSLTKFRQMIKTVFTWPELSFKEKLLIWKKNVFILLSFHGHCQKKFGLLTPKISVEMTKQHSTFPLEQFEGDYFILKKKLSCYAFRLQRTIFDLLTQNVQQKFQNWFLIVHKNIFKG